jgi:endonuclease-3
MPGSRWPLADALARLRARYGAPRLPVRDPFAMALWESCAYLVDDARRASVYARLRKATGGRPERIAGMPRGALAELIAEDGGMQPAMRAEKLQRAANLALDLGGPAALTALCRKDPAGARRALKRFPGIGDPGADKILMVAGSLATLAPESNGARVLVRLGFGKADARYDRMYRSVAAATAAELPARPADRIAAHLLLRLHGKTLCKAGLPDCPACPLVARCPGAR